MIALFIIQEAIDALQLMNPNMQQATKNFTTYVRSFRISSKSAKALTTQPHLTEKV